MRYQLLILRKAAPKRSQNFIQLAMTDHDKARRYGNESTSA